MSDLSGPAGHVFDVSTAEFEDKVLRKSTEVPVIVDFWAPWCQPCLQLGPLLEKLVNEQGGRVVLAKVDVDQNQDLAMMFRAQSIPAVYAVVNGDVVDNFMGVLPEEQLRQWISGLVPSRAQELVSEALAIEETDQVTAEAKLRESLTLEKHDETKIHLARVLAAQSRDADAAELIAELETRGYLEPEAETVKAQLELRAAAAESGGVTEARAAVEADPDNAILKVALADALAVSGKHGDAFELLLQVVETRLGTEDANKAREQMLNLFTVLGNGHALVNEYRRKLATALY
jgi:putative thioredoxin